MLGPEVVRGRASSHPGARGAATSQPSENPMASENIVTVTEDTFDAEVLNSDVPVVVDFWAVWCGPCKAIAPLLDQVATERAGGVKIAKLDVDSNRGIAMKNGVRNIPTLMLFKGGEKVATHVGTLNTAQLDAFIAQAN